MKATELYTKISESGNIKAAVAKKKNLNYLFQIMTMRFITQD